MRLIDADVAQSIADKELFIDEAGTVQFVLSHTPTIDAVEVVRCRDCKHYWKNKNTPGYLDKCVTVSDNDYCSDGERKDGEG